MALNDIVRIERELLRGAGPTAVLTLLAGGEMYGYELAEALDVQSSGVLGLGHSTLYPMLYNLESKELIASTERVAESGRTRRYYRLTASGRKALGEQRRQWQALVQALAQLGIVSS